ncbi:ATP synthase delta/epsilon chain alpha-helix domain-containing protein [Clostridium septicum]|uniref:ATP synthase epsilon chain n=1 Tax=Clostridium septicum TaxID=1504 RepID=A0A9N7JMI5_CLOSE|nr:ATP synthase delta/epsilon chain alpha-helix domain-containing protein [Clostridium septicum]AYE34745.1 F0F1 ATP synthase subunit epsilon [Clostridium septicum]MDU1312746.1 ATP synthase delta/epsilon chain alpha-helix domain-containing protein [Clostridium septicum]QAS60147.1 F0F1 ATP synthase subunit epsilon [Clostridium septicum]UEC20608.1 F0F1 ATP synthase subunit epsilon [Clostridium septicum]USS01338.1 F0F1 ATP synthase subunit epsilon [Clostridium septicum]
MAKTFKVDIITPGNEPIHIEVESLQTGTSNGAVEFRANHTAIILSTIPATTTIIKADGKKEKMFTSSGIIYLKDNNLKFCCDAVEYSQDIDLSRAENAKERAEKRLKENKDIDIERAKMALARANARIQTFSIND